MVCRGIHKRCVVGLLDEGGYMSRIIYPKTNGLCPVCGDFKEIDGRFSTDKRKCGMSTAYVKVDDPEVCEQCGERATMLSEASNDSCSSMTLVCTNCVRIFKAVYVGGRYLQEVEVKKGQWSISNE